MPKFERLAVLSLALSLAGCVQLPTLKQPAPDLPKAWPAQTEKGADLSGAEWWSVYTDPTLDKLIAEALANNSDIRLAAARVEEARAGVGLADADRYPSVSAQASSSRSKLSERGVNPVPGDTINNTFKASFQAAYELDLWGRYRNASEAARADLLASEYAAQVVRASLAASVAHAWFALSALEAQRQLAVETQANRRDALKLVRLRLEGGLANELELRQAEAELAGVDASLAQVTRQARAQELALGVLLGREPRRLVEDSLAAGKLAASAPPAVPSGLPSDLLRRRPDLRQAEQTLIAAEARMRETHAAIYPDLALTAYLGSESKALSDLFSGKAGVWGLTASVVQTVFNAGRTEAAVQASVARREQLLASYEGSVRNAFREVLDALVAHRQAREVGDAETRRVEALTKAADLASLRYDNGMTGYLELLDARRNLYQARANGIEARRAQLAAVADLALALGGGWREVDTPKP
jgi:multidrug efflux system outer membrane protein